MIESGALFTIGIDIIIPVPLVSAIIAFYHFLLRVRFFCASSNRGVLLAFGKPQTPAIRVLSNSNLFGFSRKKKKQKLELSKSFVSKTINLTLKRKLNCFELAQE
uniref:(northern house mosquito) hypothetical protein n=1 Tax=Culex pipiens TaxID=7175 RepID=A0A8D8GI07_CULPI